MSEEAIDAGYHAAIAIQEWKARAQDAEACCVQLQHDKREAEARALKYEQALREIEKLDKEEERAPEEIIWRIMCVVRAVLDKPEGK